MPLGANSYGKSGIRLVRLAREGEAHDLQDLTVAVRFEGDFEAAHLAGDNTAILPTDTMKNTVYALALESRAEEIEDLGLVLSKHFLEGNPAASSVEISIEQRLWNRLDATAFEGSRSDRRTTRVSRGRNRTTIESGLTDLLITGVAGFVSIVFPVTWFAASRSRHARRVPPWCRTARWNA